MDELLEFLRSEDADIVFLQEVYNGAAAHLKPNFRTMQVLTDRLDYAHQVFDEAFVQRYGEDYIPIGNALLSKLPVLSHRPILLTEAALPYYEEKPEHWPIMPALLQHAELKLTNKTLDVYNLHGVWDLDGDAYTDRRQIMSKEILKAISGKKNVILAGDTNAKSSNRAVREIEADLRPVFGQELKTTFNMRRKTNPGYGTAAVDLMFVSPDIKIVSKNVPDIDVSDHLPLVVELEFSQSS